MRYENGTLVTDHSSHEIFVVADGKLRWVPDAWTMQVAGLSPADLVVAEDGELGSDDIGEPLPSAVPSIPLTEGMLIESESGVWRARDGLLDRITDPVELVVVEGVDPTEVVFLPDSVIRSAKRIER